MSVINQMLRELDARGGLSSDAPEVSARAPAHPGNLHKWGAMGLLLALVAGLGYWMMPTPAYRHAPVLATPTPPSQPDAPFAPPRAAMPPADKLNPPPVPRAVKRETEQPKPPVIPLIQMATSLSIDPPQPVAKARPLVSPPPHLPAQVQSEPAASKNASVIKKMTELSPEAEAQQSFDEAQILRRAGQTEAAIGKYRQALIRDPGMRSARLQLAGLLQEAGQFDKALLVLTTGYEQQSDDALAIAAGRMLADQGQREEALNWLKRGQAGMRPADIALMGALLSQLQRYEESARAYQRALAADPSQGGWLLGLGLALEALGRMDEARAAYRKALERGDFKPEVIDFLQKKTS
jgi:MSHA biogenesis protein MshN